jgi:hypothetical protein
VYCFSSSYLMSVLGPMMDLWKDRGWDDVVILTW